MNKYEEAWHKICDWVYDNHNLTPEKVDLMNEKVGVAIQELVDEVTSKKPIRIHKIKIELQYFEKSAAGLKPWELRLNDRDYKVGDILILREWDPKKKEFTGRILTRQITEMFKGLPYLPEDVVIMTIL